MVTGNLQSIIIYYKTTGMSENEAPSKPDSE